jgi:head-tail adaptor
MPIGRSVLTGKPMIAAGQRDKYVTIEQMTESAPNGFPVETWTELAQEWMSRRDLRAYERFAGGQESAFAEAQWQMAYRSDMDPELEDVPKTRRLVYRGRTHDIVTASLIGREHGIELLTLAGSNVA